jgi:hypothetical protein
VGLIVRASFILAVAALAAPSAPAAHDLWLGRDGDGLVLRYGHRGGEALPIDPAQVTSIRCLERGGATKEIRAAAVASPTAIRVAATCEVASALVDGGFRSLTPDGEVNLPRTKVAQSVRSWQSRQFAKWVDARSPAAGIVLGDELEIVLVGDASRSRVGDKVAVRVLSRGRPVPGAVVAVDHKPLGETDSAGETRVRIRSSAVETVDATLKRPLGSPEAETQVLEASLTFEVAR